MRKIILPPVLMLTCIIAMFIAKNTLSMTLMPINGYDDIGYIFAGAGLLFPAWASYVFRQAQTNIMPYNDPDNMVTNGPFRLSRNPMYLGMLLVLIGIFIKIGYLENIVFPVLYFSVANWWYIPFEEERMHAVFGDKFDVYKQKVRRWL